MEPKKVIFSLVIVGSTNQINFTCAEGNRTTTSDNKVAKKQCKWFMEAMNRGVINYLPCVYTTFLSEAGILPGPNSFCLINIPLSLAKGLAESFLQSEFWYLKNDGDRFICTRFAVQVDMKNKKIAKYNPAGQKSVKLSVPDSFYDAVWEIKDDEAFWRSMTNGTSGSLKLHLSVKVFERHPKKMQPL